MKDRNLHGLAQLLLDVEAFRRLDIFEVDAAESRLEQRQAAMIWSASAVFSSMIEDVDIGESFEKDAFALHDGLAGQAPILPSPRTADPLVTTPTRFPLAVYL